jgi:phosphoribosylformylglycinamidine (FGAM) synthase PurS component
MTAGQRMLIETILETRQLAPEIVLAVQLLLDQEDGAVSKDQVHQLVVDLLMTPEIEDAEIRVGGIIHR